MVNALNGPAPLFCMAVLIVAAAFGVGALFGKLVRRDEAPESDLRVGWNRQASELAVNDLNGFAAHASGPIQLALTIDRTLDTRSQKQQRIAADDGDQRTGLSALHIFFFYNAAVVRRRGADADTVLVE